MTADARRATLADLASVRPDGGLVETDWYGIDPVVDQVRAVIELGQELTVPVLAGGGLQQLLDNFRGSMSRRCRIDGRVGYRQYP
jgi:hypothetical protein